MFIFTVHVRKQTQFKYRCMLVTMFYVQIYPSVGCGSESRSCFSEKERCAVIFCVMCDEKLVETDLQRKGEIEADTKETTGDRICFSYREKKRNQVAISGK